MNIERSGHRPITFKIKENTYKLYSNNTTRELAFRAFHEFECFSIFDLILLFNHDKYMSLIKNGQFPSTQKHLDMIKNIVTNTIGKLRIKYNSTNLLHSFKVVQAALPATETTDKKAI